MSVVFDPIQTLKSAGLTEKQAVAQVQVITQLLDERITVNRYLRGLEAKIEELKTEIIKRILPSVIYDEVSQVIDIEIPSGGIDLNKLLNGLEKNLLLKALERSEGSTAKAARLLKITIDSLKYRMTKYKI